MRHLLYLPLRPEELAIAVIAPLGEEFGFRGYALPRLQTRWSPMAASAWLGVGWAVWHVRTLLVPSARGTTPLELCLYLTCYLAGSAVYTWLFNAGYGSIVGPLLAHLGIHLDNVFRASTVGDGIAPLADAASLRGVVGRTRRGGRRNDRKPYGVCGSGRLPSCRVNQLSGTHSGFRRHVARSKGPYLLSAFRRRNRIARPLAPGLCCAT